MCRFVPEGYYNVEESFCRAILPISLELPVLSPHQPPKALFNACKFRIQDAELPSPNGKRQCDIIFGALLKRRRKAAPERRRY